MIIFTRLLRIKISPNFKIKFSTVKFTDEVFDTPENKQLATNIIVKDRGILLLYLGESVNCGLILLIGVRSEETN